MKVSRTHLSEDGGEGEDQEGECEKEVKVQVKVRVRMCVRMIGRLRVVRWSFG